MKAVSYDRHGGSGVMRIVEADTPTPGPGEILIRVAAASINPFDWKLRNGILREHFAAQFPVVPGRDGSGSVVAHGEEIDEVQRDILAVGQRVCFVASRLFQGTHAEYAAVTAKDNVVPIPDDLDYASAAALALGGVSAWNAVVETAAVENGMRVLVHGGSGGIGSLAIQLCQSLGAETWATSSAAKADAVEALGARFALKGVIALDIIRRERVPIILSGRWLAVDRDDIRFAVTLTETIVPPAGDFYPLETHLSPGFALDAGGERVRFDLSVPLWGISTVGSEFGLERFPVPIFTSGGVNLMIHENHRVRIGWPELGSYHFTTEHFFFDVGCSTVLLAGTAWVKVGGIL